MPTVDVRMSVLIIELIGDELKSLQRIKNNKMLNYVSTTLNLMFLLFSVARPLFSRISATVTTVPIAETEIKLSVQQEEEL